MTKQKKKINSQTKENTSEEDLTKFFKKELKAGHIVDSKEMKFISTGSTWLDYCISNRKNGGIPSGRIVEICGHEASGKSLLAYHIMANAQKQGGIAVYIDIERSLNKDFMMRMGVDTNKLIIPKHIPNSIEEVFEYIESIVKVTQIKFPNKDKPIVVVWDSVAATMSKETIEEGFGSGRLTPEARSMSDCLKRAMPMLDMGFITLVCINQLRTKVGTMFGDPDITPHGKALPFYASVRIKMEAVGFKKLRDENGRTIGIPTKATVFKNKIGPSHRSARFNVQFDWGIDDPPSLYYLLEQNGKIEKKAGWRIYVDIEENEHKFQDADGTTKWRELMKDEKFYENVLKHTEELLTIKYERRPETYSINEESYLEVEQLKNDISGL